VTGGRALAAEWRLGCARICDFGAELTGPVIAGVFTPAERAHSGARRAREGFAGRLAAKHAVAGVLGARADDPGVLRAVQIIPGPRHPCRSPALCRRGHPPAVELASAVGDSDLLVWIDVSVSHERELAFAAAIAVLARPSGG
jgi:holo-[acyl-carrier protein] synthase